ncbi:cell division protein ZapA [Psychrobacter lutiphocae]|uniref:cell division protein ZapA n=1 Tax=Psychrobacter lutiphocae TaxID=540500 RepID=UPI00036A1923|nr:cell division protein ZapA [Psychrobacter lutiphocae]
MSTNYANSNQSQNAETDTDTQIAATHSADTHSVEASLADDYLTGDSPNEAGDTGLNQTKALSELPEELPELPEADAQTQQSELESQTETAEDKDAEDNPESAYTTVSIDILGRSYNINCPVGEEDELVLATKDINTFLNDLREKMPHIGYENLLVLCCLNLFNRLQQKDKDANAHASANHATAEQAQQLIDKMIADMQFFKD